MTWVDGGMLRNFPINAFDREDGGPAPLAHHRRQAVLAADRVPATKAAGPRYGEARGCLHTMMNEWDAYGVDAATAGRTIFVDNAGISTTDFDLTHRPAQRAVPERRPRRPPTSSSRWVPGAGSRAPRARRASSSRTPDGPAEPAERRVSRVGRRGRRRGRARTTRRRVETGVGEPAQLVGHRRGPVVVAGQRRHGVGRVERDHDVAEDEAPARAQHLGDPAEERGLVGALEVVDGQGGDDEVEGAGGQRVGQLGHTQLDRAAAASRARAASSIGRALVDADGAAPRGGGPSTAARVSPVPVPRSSTRDSRHSLAGGGDRLLQAAVGGHLWPASDRGRWPGRSGTGSRESSASRRTQAQRSTKSGQAQRDDVDGQLHRGRCRPCPRRRAAGRRARPWRRGRARRRPRPGARTGPPAAPSGGSRRRRPGTGPASRRPGGTRPRTGCTRRRSPRPPGSGGPARRPSRRRSAGRPRGAGPPWSAGACLHPGVSAAVTKQGNPRPG